MTTRTAWLADRRTGIGSSDAPIILGVSPWGSAYQLYCEKIGLVADDEEDDLPEHMEWGNRLQVPITAAFRERTGRDVVDWSGTEVVRHREIAWMLATPDALQHAPDHDDLGLLEIKNSGGHMTKSWKEGPPLYYQVQLQHALHVTGLRWGSLCVLLGGQKLKWFDQEYDAEFAGVLVEALAKFWGCVQRREPPAVDGSQATAKLLAKMHPDDNGETVALPEEFCGWSVQLERAKAAIRDAEELKREAENHLRAAIGDCTYAALPNGDRWQLTTRTVKEHVRKASTFRVLTRMGGD